MVVKSKRIGSSSRRTTSSPQTSGRSKRNKAAISTTTRSIQSVSALNRRRCRWRDDTSLSTFSSATSFSSSSEASLNPIPNPVPPCPQEDNEPVVYSNMTCNGLKALLKQRGLPVSGRKHELISRLEEDDLNDGSNSRSWPTGQEWKNSFAKAFLVKCLDDPKSKFNSMTPEQIYDSHKSFHSFPRDRFIINVNNLKASRARVKKIIAEDEREFSIEQSLFPRRGLTSRGKPFWDTHKANESLKMDVEAGKLEEMKPRELRLTRQEYQEFSVQDFCKYCHQEKRAQREKPYWIPLRNKAGLSKYEAEVQDCKSEFDNLMLQEDIDGIAELLENTMIST